MTLQTWPRDLKMMVRDMHFLLVFEKVKVIQQFFIQFSQGIGFANCSIYPAPLPILKVSILMRDLKKMWFLTRI